jgi:hypothetical protein
MGGAGAEEHARACVRHGKRPCPCWVASDPSCRPRTDFLSLHLSGDRSSHPPIRPTMLPISQTHFAHFKIYISTFLLIIN